MHKDPDLEKIQASASQREDVPGLLPLVRSFDLEDGFVARDLSPEQLDMVMRAEARETEPASLAEMLGQVLKSDPQYRDRPGDVEQALKYAQSWEGFLDARFGDDEPARQEWIGRHAKEGVLEFCDAVEYFRSHDLTAEQKQEIDKFPDRELPELELTSEIIEGFKQDAFEDTELCQEEYLGVEDLRAGTDKLEVELDTGEKIHYSRLVNRLEEVRSDSKAFMEILDSIEDQSIARSLNESISGDRLKLVDENRGIGTEDGICPFERDEMPMIRKVLYFMMIEGLTGNYHDSEDSRHVIEMVTLLNNLMLRHYNKQQNFRYFMLNFVRLWNSRQFANFIENDCDAMTEVLLMNVNRCAILDEDQHSFKSLTPVLERRGTSRTAGAEIQDAISFLGPSERDHGGGGAKQEKREEKEEEDRKKKG